MQVGKPKVSWEAVRKYVYGSGGSLPDIYVLDTSRDDWSRWVDFVNANYPVKFLFQGENRQEQDTIDLEAVFTYWDGDRQDDAPFAYFTVGQVQLNCFFLSDDIIDSDIDPRQIKEQADHEQLLHYLISVARLLAKKVVVLAEATRFVTDNTFNPEPLFTIDKNGLPSSLIGKRAAN